MEIKNAKITGTFLGIDEGRMILRVGLNYGGTVQGATWPTQDFDSGTIKELLKCLEIDQWEHLVGTPVRVKSSMVSVDAIGHFIEDQWFEFSRKVETAEAKQ